MNTKVISAFPKSTMDKILVVKGFLISTDAEQQEFFRKKSLEYEDQMIFRGLVDVLREKYF